MKLSKINNAMATAVIAMMAAMPNSGFAGTIPGAVNDHIPLGTAYNSITGELLNFQTAKGEVIELNQTDSSVRFFRNLRFEEASSRLSGDLTVNADFPVVQAEANASVALDIASNSYSSNWVLSVINTAPSQVLRGINNAPFVALSPQGQAIANQNLNDSQLLAAAGTEYVAGINYGTQLIVSLKADFLNTEDRQNIEGAISVDFATGNVSGNLSVLSQEQRDSTTITVSAYQFGGDPLALLSILPNNIITCSLNNFDPCRDLMSQAIEYAQGVGAYANNGFKQQVATIEGSNVLGYVTDEYENNAGTFSLAPSTPYVVDNNAVVLNNLQSEYVQQLENYNRATELLTKSLNYLNVTQRAALRSTSVVALNNAEALADLIDYCNANPINNSCITYIGSNCPVQGTNRSCVDEYSTAVFSLTTDSAFDMVVNEYSEPVSALTIEGLYNKLLHKDDGFFYDPQVYPYPFVLDSLTGKLSFEDYLAFSSPSTVNTSFMIKSTGRIKTGSIFPNGSQGFNGSRAVLRVYNNGQWQIARDNAAYYQAVMDGATPVNGFYYYTIELENITYPIVDLISYSASNDFYFYNKPVVQVDMTTGFTSTNAPFYFTSENINIAKDIGNNDIGWCANGSGWTRSNNADCENYGRYYSWADAFKACEAYNEQYSASTGLLWSLPTQAEIDTFVDRVEQDSGVGNAGTWLKSYQFILGSTGNDALGFGLQPAGWVFSNGTRSSRDVAGGFWLADENSSNSSEAKYVYAISSASYFIQTPFAKNGRNTVRCIGKYTK